MAKQKKRVLIVEDDIDYGESLSSVLQDDFETSLATSVGSANDKLGPDIDLVLVDVRLDGSRPERKEGIELLQSIKVNDPDLPVVIMTGAVDIDLAIEAMKLGASDFIQKNKVDIREFRKVINKAIEAAKTKVRLEFIETERRMLEPWEMVGEAASIQKIREMVDVVAQDGFSSVLVRGETGTGKELVARAVHNRGRRSEELFVPVSIPSLSSTVIESELFGHVKGAFTDATSDKKGYFEKANGGVLFLDEVGELSMDIQIKLLRFLETRQFQKVGSTNAVGVELQLVAATNRDLELAIQEKEFREDLFYRLNTVEIVVPPLRERKSDLGLLVDHFLYLFRKQGRCSLAGIRNDALEKLKKYDFPGNIRELKAIIERAMMLAATRRHNLIESEDLAIELGASQVVGLSDDGLNLEFHLAKTELSLINQALVKSEGKKSEAWKMLGLNDRFALLRRVKKIAEKAPELIADFPAVHEHYFESK